MTKPTPYDAQQLRHAMQEGLRRWATNPTANYAARTTRANESLHRVMRGLFDKQLAVPKDPSRRVAIFCPRRAGKTSLLVPWLIQEAFACQDPGATIFVIGPTLEHARALMWRPLQALDETYDLGLQLVRDPARCILPNGVHIYFRGARDSEQLGVLRGFKNLMVVIDEVQDIKDGILYEIFAATGPGLRDLNGRMVVAGTPGRVAQGIWYEISTKRRANWSVHSWTMFDNPHLPPDAKNFEIIRQEEGLSPEDPRFKREYLGLWIEDNSELVYRFSVEHNGIPGKEVDLDQNLDWHYVMGVDFGHHDSSAVVMGAFSYETDQYYEVAEAGGPGLTISDFMDQCVLPFIKQYAPMRIVGDPAARQLIAEINQRWGINMLKADKPGKLAFIDLMNSDFLLGRIHTPMDFELTRERMQLIWDPLAKPRLVEHPKRPNHFCDAALYAYREAKHWNTGRVVTKKHFRTSLEREAFELAEYARNLGRVTEPDAADWANDDDFI